MSREATAPNVSGRVERFVHNKVTKAFCRQAPRALLLLLLRLSLRLVMDTLFYDDAASGRRSCADPENFGPLSILEMGVSVNLVTG